MALAALATSADLAARSVDITNTGLVTAMLAAASASVRDAAGCPITTVTSTVTVPGTQDNYLQLPGGPVTNVGAVLLDGTTVTDFNQVGDQLFRLSGWQALDYLPSMITMIGWQETTYKPSVVTVTYTHGLAAAPDDIVDLVCSLAAAGMALAAAGYHARGDVVSERVDDYQVTYPSGPDSVAGPMELPQATRDRLRARFTGQTAVVEMR